MKSENMENRDLLKENPLVDEVGKPIVKDDKLDAKKINKEGSGATGTIAGTTNEEILNGK